MEADVVINSSFPRTSLQDTRFTDAKFAAVDFRGSTGLTAAQLKGACILEVPLNVKAVAEIVPPTPESDSAPVPPAKGCPSVSIRGLHRKDRPDRGACR